MQRFLRYIQKMQWKRLGVVLLLVVILTFPTVTFAAEDPIAVNEFLRKIVEALVNIERLVYFLLTPAIALIGMLLSNDWVLGTASGLDRTLEAMWVFVRNLVNIMFVVVLLFMAFVHIVKSQSGDVGDYGIKSMLPNIVIAVVVVNFSLLGCRLILDASSLLTSAVFSIPNTVSSLEYPFKELDDYAFTWTDNADEGPQECLRKHYYFNINKTIATQEKQTTPASSGGTGTSGTTTSAPKKTKVTEPVKHTGILVPMKACSVQDEEQLIAAGNFYTTGNDNGKRVFYCEGSTFEELRKGLDKDDPKIKEELRSECILDMDSLLFNERNAMYAFAFGLLHLPSYDKIVSGNETLENITLSTLVSVVFLAMIMLVIYALTVALLLRSVLLWGLIVASPLWVLEIVFKGGGPFQEITKNTSLKTFVGVAFMPVMVGAVLSVSFIMLVAIKASFGELGLGKNQLGMGGMNFFFGDNTVMAGFGSIQDFIFALLVIVVLWTGVFAAIKSGDVAGIIGQSISGVENIGKQVGEIATKLPGSTPFIPVGGGKKASMNSLITGANKYTGDVARQLDRQAEDEAGSVFGRLPGWNGSLSSQARGDLDRLTREQKPTMKNVMTGLVNIDSSQLSSPDVTKTFTETLNKAKGQQTDLGRYINSNKGQEILKELQAGNKLTENMLQRFVEGYNGSDKAEIAKLYQQRGGTTSPINAPVITNGITRGQNGNYVRGDQTVLQGDDAIRYGTLKSKLDKFHTDSTTLLNGDFLKALTNTSGTSAAGAEDAAKRLKQSTGVAELDETTLQNLATALYEGDEVKKFVDTYKATTRTAAGGTPPPTQ